MSQQGYRQASVRAVTGTTGTYEGDFHALFTLAGIPAGDFDGRFLQWLNIQLGRTYTNLPEAMQAFATLSGGYSWSALGTFNAGGANANALTSKIGDGLTSKAGDPLTSKAA